MKVFVGLLLVAIALAVAEAQEYTLVSSSPSSKSITEAAEYECQFINSWTASRHPNSFPSSTAHWSPPVLTGHGDGYDMWKAGEMASTGVERVAESGSTTTISNEINAAINAGDALSLVIGRSQFHSVTMEQTLDKVQVDMSHPFLSSITMVAPSPDWFTGFAGFKVHDDSTYFDQFVLDTYPWDAGTETGAGYSTSNLAESTPQPIMQLTTSPINVFVNNDQVLPVARWECKLATSSGPVDSPVPGDASGPFDWLFNLICFSSSNSVEVLGRGTIPIGDLQIGDLVKTSARGEFSRVYSFAHKDTTTRATYRQIWAGTDRIEISPLHMMFVNGSLKRAADITVGDQVADSRMVSKIDSVVRPGLFAPLTENGRILVSGIEASNYVSFLDIEPSWQAWMYHGLLAPIRLTCSFNREGCARETYINGISGKYYRFIGVSRYLGELSRSSQWIIVLVSAPLAFLGWAFDWLVIRHGILLAFAGCAILRYLFPGSKSKLQ